MVERARLTDILALAAQPREREYAIHDETLRGFILRVQPGGSRSWVLRFRRDGRPRRVTLGKVGTTTADQARAAALALLARDKADGRAIPPPASGPTLARFATEYVERCSPAWKPSTRKATMSYLRHAILPVIGALRVNAVTRADVARWLYEYGRERPGGANRAHDILRDMFNRAMAWGHRSEATGNPCTGITRYRRPPRGRLLGEDDAASVEEAPHRALGDPQPMLALEMGRDLRQGHVRGLFDQRQGRLGSCLDPLRAPVAALCSGPIVTRQTPRLNPLYRRGWGDPEALRRSPPRHPVIHRRHHPAAQIIRKRSCHAGWPPSPACILNHISKRLILDPAVAGERARRIEAYNGNIQMIDSSSVRVHQHAAGSKRGVRIVAWVVPEAN